MPTSLNWPRFPGVTIERLFLGPMLMINSSQQALLAAVQSLSSQSLWKPAPSLEDKVMSASKALSSFSFFSQVPASVCLSHLQLFVSTPLSTCIPICNLKDIVQQSLSLPSTPLPLSFPVPHSISTAVIGGEGLNVHIAVISTFMKRSRTLHNSFFGTLY